MKGKAVNRRHITLVAGAVGAVVLTLPVAACTSSKPQSSGSGETANGATPAGANIVSTAAITAAAAIFSVRYDIPEVPKN